MLLLTLTQLLAGHHLTGRYAKNTEDPTAVYVNPLNLRPPRGVNLKALR